MGTNYYVRHNVCGHCDRYEELHVGKSGTSVQAYLQRPWEFEPPTPFGNILSWADWKRFLAEIPHQVFDEYGREMTDEELIQVFESSSPEMRRRQYDYEHNHAVWAGTSKTYLDDDGFSVSPLEFS